MKFGHRNEAREKTITDEQLDRFIKAIPFVEEDKYVIGFKNMKKMSFFSIFLTRFRKNL